MHTPRFTSLGFFLVSALPLLAAEPCQEVSDIVAAAVVSKPKMSETLKKNPQKGTLGEAWRYSWFASTADLDKLRVPTAEQECMFRTIFALRFSKKMEVDMDILRDYFYLRCKRKARGLSSTPLESIPKAALVRCWDTVANRTQFQACEEKLMEPKSKDAR